ncbi:MAG: hypothetical protein CMJ46_02880 [Planctomyces sp.]|nr:hypothetical protein [Planctomyces sp.]
MFDSRISFIAKLAQGSALSLAFFCLLCPSISAQESEGAQTAAEETRGFLPVLTPNPSSAELELQDDLWILDVAFKPMRMIPLELTNPKTGEKERKNVWYLVYKVRNTPLERPADPGDLTPVNVEDARRIGHIFIPEFELITEDNGQTRSYKDEINPEAVKLISERERLPLQSSIEIAGDLAKLEPGEFEYGVAVWTGIDPKTDFFKLYATGFSSAYRINPENGTLLKRTIEIKYTRPGDEYEEVELEFRPATDPEWMFRPTELEVNQTASK